MKRTNSIIWGIVLIAAGVIYALSTLGIADIDVFFDGWWTLFIIVPCIFGLFNDNDKTGSIIGIIVGTALLLAAQGLFSFDLIWKLALPAIIVIAGLKLVSKGVLNSGASETIKRMKGSGIPLKQCCATFSGQDIDYSGEVFDGAELTAIFGGVKCDLRKAVIEKDAVIDICCVFGGVDVIVPENVNIKIVSNSLFGGISCNRNKNSKDNAITLYINGTCIFGGAEIK